MGSGHSHSHQPTFEAPRGAVRIVLLALLPLLALTIAGLIALWPSKVDLPVIPIGTFTDGLVLSIEACDNGDPACAVATVEVTEGPDKGTTAKAVISLGDATPPLEPGTKVLLQAVPDAPPDQGYALVDVNRGRPLLILTLMFVAAVVVMARWKGITALVGLILSLAILSYFVLPSLLAGNSPVLVAAVGAGAIAILAMGMAHGFNVQTGVALIGTLIALALTTLLGWVFTQAMAFTGLGSEDAAFLSAIVADRDLDLRGLLLAGLVIGALGVLDDITVTQAATVWEVYGAKPNSSFRNLWDAGMRVGRSHVAAVTNTLVLAYAGAALPLFLLLSLSDAPLLQSINNEALASEVVRALVGGLGIIAAVPITTALAAWLLVDTQRRAVAKDRFLSR